MKSIGIFFLTIVFLFAKDFTVASYNVENLFDEHYDGTEYKEFDPRSKFWNKQKYETKLSNAVFVLQKLNADIVGVQEIESQRVFEELKKHTGYPYGVFIKNNASAIGLGLLSKERIQNYEKIQVNKYDKYARDILKVALNIDGNFLVVYVNHWKSKRTPESSRIPYALALKKDIEKLPKNSDYIVLGDLNSNYDEFLTFKYDKKLNDTSNITGINHILNTLENGNLVNENILLTKDDLNYNLWLELDQRDRFSVKFKNELQTPDNMIISKGMYDGVNISYRDNSFSVFKTKEIYNNGKVIRWNHQNGFGFSDHLPIIAKFTTSNISFDDASEDQKKQLQTIGQLYKLQSLEKPIDLYDCTVIYKSSKIAIIKQKFNKAVAIYKPDERLKVGYSYTITASKIDYFNGNLQITQTTFIGHEKKVENLASYYIDSNGLGNENNINEVVQNIHGVYKNRKLHYDGGFINIYFDKNIQRPQENQKIYLKQGVINRYKSKLQISVYDKNDFLIQ